LNKTTKGITSDRRNWYWKYRKSLLFLSRNHFVFKSL